MLSSAYFSVETVATQPGSSGSELVPRFAGDRHSPGFGRVLVLAMASRLQNLEPAIFDEQPDHVSYLRLVPS